MNGIQVIRQGNSERETDCRYERTLPFEGCYKVARKPCHRGGCGLLDLAATQSVVLAVVSISFMLLMRWYQGRRDYH
jgi:hypothetical protein